MFDMVPTPQFPKCTILKRDNISYSNKTEMVEKYGQTAEVGVVGSKENALPDIEERHRLYWWNLLSPYSNFNEWDIWSRFAAQRINTRFC